MSIREFISFASSVNYLCSDIGKDGQRNLWLIVQHADQDVMFQRAALAAMERLKDPTEIDVENYAFLYDRVQCNLNFKQLYGTQVQWTSNGAASGFRRIVREDLVDERRKKLGLLPLSIYALSYGFRYRNVTRGLSGKTFLKLAKNASQSLPCIAYFELRH